MVASNFCALDRDETVINEEPLANLHHLGDVLVVKPQHILSALLLEGVIGGDLDGGTSLQA